MIKLCICTNLVHDLFYLLDCELSLYHALLILLVVIPLSDIIERDLLLLLLVFSFLFLKQLFSPVFKSFQIIILLLIFFQHAVYLFYLTLCKTCLICLVLRFEESQVLFELHLSVF